VAAVAFRSCWLRLQRLAFGGYLLRDAPGFGVAFDADFIKTYPVN
jgi:hypothetical protein